MSPDELGFDPFDERLGRELRAAAPAATDADGALAALRPRFARARERRRVAIAGAWGLAGAGVVAVGLVVFGPGGTGSIHTPPATRPDRGVTTTTTTTDETSTTDPVVPGTGPDDTTLTTDDHGGNRGPGGGDNSGADSSASDSGSGSGSSPSGGDD